LHDSPRSGPNAGGAAIRSEWTCRPAHGPATHAQEDFGMANHAEPTNPSGQSAWIRLLYLILYALILNIAEGVTFVVTVVQFIFHLFTGRPNSRLSELGEGLAAYVRDVVAFLTYHVDALPFPFGAWPSIRKSDKAE
jgi:hypothetical protein